MASHPQLVSLQLLLTFYRPILSAFHISIPLSLYIPTANYHLPPHLLLPLVTSSTFKHTKMGGYSKIKIMGAGSSSRSRNSRSIDFSDLQSFSQTQKSTPKNPTSSKIQEETNLNLQHMKKNNPTHDSSEEDCQNKGNGGERFGTHVMHKRSSSVSSFSSSASASATGLGLGLGFQSALKGAFSSMRRSSSVSERYCRIHDQSATTALTSSIDGNEEDDEDHQATRSTKKKHKGGGKILKVCKRFFRM
ncbi:uncharacterized protein LOC125478779 [Pyrus x bretschneideri]|uniref:uncharacterized protein LOC125478779 n=1 Tax=Pyrus x bretschneideri TaxID=225117 RepID=UPI00202E51B4|nr:uncharacterized protein LOC125478779 [Pyrus x bretschneideri]